ncbi:LOW QUALITY PROTEIN: ST20 isoform 3 [Pongo abelii]|uniref:ST20 isoform 1 n=1 Tax=Pongo abelii TaxID=9601 RepID=A0A2J8SKI3_PONAB|nr:LOW QUALITY PROTEIN: ST20 isoform 1 [Pongo abelii]PNJ21298.1 LOW QUALITY PROTEIN: ST20 isoform 2 [Pongo abelii]PNJ21299.1 LOW QUALITY PROTEIN: ST20 isoform 3 [Pongo abelii]
MARSRLTATSVSQVQENGFVKKLEPKSGWMTFEVTGKICEMLSSEAILLTRKDTPYCETGLIFLTLMKTIANTYFYF